MSPMAKFYITTPIFYVNDRAHIGHFYTMVIADTLARWHRLKGDDVLFLTGTDEHGEKMVKAAAASGKEPQQFVDELATSFRDTWNELGISYDDFIRTTEQRHIDTVTRFLERMQKNGDLYRGVYEGWYCVPDETFFTELQLKDGKCPQCGREVTRLKEESYFFKLGAYRERLLRFYEENPEFLSPALRSQEILNRVRGGLKDLSISRATVTWGIPLPMDKSFTVYVWVEALINYLSALNWPDTEKMRMWPADVHIVGKEINWFHSVIWPAMLMSAGVQPPRKVFAHGWWTVDGEKMSKSKGNAIDPIKMVQRYQTDALRYFMLREMPLGDDGDFSEKKLVARINGELVADLGNLASRILTLAERFDGKLEGAVDLEGELELEQINHFMDAGDLFQALEEIWAFIRACNKYINEMRPWELGGEELGRVLYNLAESLRIISILISPFMPQTSGRINEQLGVVAGTLNDCTFRRFDGRIKKGSHLFEKIEQEK